MACIPRGFQPPQVFEISSRGGGGQFSDMPVTELTVGRGDDVPQAVHRLYSHGLERPVTRLISLAAMHAPGLPVLASVLSQFD